ncbi:MULTISPECIES: hypothetical protein [Flavobacterium]|uniref:Outer membrane protein beta-barrel domain-containing protein n=1 Tax=Flavobacterium commune TaxID=1306519 RepID=A0A1D9P6K8_9FLAO|nr:MULTISPECIES: hypothetical protein [Flavobacterium]AOZ98236.1 hypothetical protein BIW12_01600 [Flavobacterium commune]
MKKIILTTAAIFAFGFANAQSGAFKLGAHVGLPTGDMKDISSVNLGADLAYTWSVAEGLDAGITTGYTTYLGKDGWDDASFIPVAATAQFTLTNNWFIGADLGYGIGVNDGNEGAFMYQPKFGYQMEKAGLYVAYKGFSKDGFTVSSINLGVNFKL